MEKMEHVFYAQYDFNPFSQTWSCKEFEKVTKSQKIELLPIFKWYDDILRAKDEYMF